MILNRVMDNRYLCNKLFPPAINIQPVSNNILPYYTVYPGDEQKNPAICTLDLAEYGLLFKLRNYMASSEVRGYLKVNGKVIQKDKVLVMVGVNVEGGRRLIQNLIDAGVIAQEKDGTLYDPEMVSREETRRKRALGGAKGGNPELKKKEKKVNLIVNDDDNQKRENETVIDNVNEIVNEVRGGAGGELNISTELDPKEREKALMDIEGCMEVFLFDKAYERKRELQMMNMSTKDPEVLKGWVEAFNRLLLKRLEINKHLGDYITHFANWMNRNYDKSINPKTLHNGNSGPTRPATGAAIVSDNILKPGDKFWSK